MNRQTKFLTLSILTILVISSLAVAWHFRVQAKKPLPDKKERRNIEIYPRECKLYPNQTQLFHVNVYDGVPPFSFRWYVNGTYYANTSTIKFQFEEPCNYIILSVWVTDKYGNIGWDQVLVYDPAFTSRPRYLEAPLPFAFLVESNGTHSAMYNGTTLQRTFLSSDSDVVVNACFGNLTSGRTWKETVKLMGNFILTGPFQPSNNSCLEGPAKLTVATGSYINAIEICSGYTGYENITIHDLEIDGNKANNPYQEDEHYQHGIFIDKTTGYSSCRNIDLDTLYVHDTPFDGIYCGYGSPAWNANDEVIGLQISNIRIEDVEHVGLELNNVQKVVADNIIAKGCVNHAGVGIFYSQNLSVHTGYIESCGGTDQEALCVSARNFDVGDFVVVGGGDVGLGVGKGSKDGTIHDLQITYLGTKPTTLIWVNGASDDLIERVDIVDVKGFGEPTNTHSVVGLQATYWKDSRLICNLRNGWSNGINLGNCLDISIEDSGIENFEGNGINVLAGSTNTHIHDTTIKSCGATLGDAGTNTIWGYGNIIDGKPCEVFGTAEASDTDSITFGNEVAGTPQTVLITVNENDARYIAMAYSISATEFNLYLWDDIANELETTDKTISYMAIYKP